MLPTPSKRPRTDAAAPDSAWVSATRAMVTQARGAQLARVERQTLRTRLEAAADPHGLSGRAGLVHGVWCQGDARLRRINLQLDNMGEQRSTTQRLWHWYMTNACLPHIYGEEWPRVSKRVMDQRGITRIDPAVLIMTFRRAGKTVCMAQFIAVLLLNVPGIRIVIISTGDRASSKLKALVVSYLFRLPGGRRRVCGLTHEILYVSEHELPDGVSFRSPQAQEHHYLAGTSRVEAIPNNPKGTKTRVERGTHAHFTNGDGRGDKTGPPTSKTAPQGSPTASAGSGTALRALI